MYRRNPKLSFKNATDVLGQSMLEAAELLWIYEAQHSIRLQVEQGQYKRLCPKICENGVVVITGRVEKWRSSGAFSNFNNVILFQCCIETRLFRPSFQEGASCQLVYM